MGGRTIYHAVAKKLVPFPPAELAVTVFEGFVGVQPHLAVSRVLVDGGDTVVNVVIAELKECFTQCFESISVAILTSLSLLIFLHIHDVPVRDIPRQSTSMGTTRTHVRLSIFVRTILRWPTGPFDCDIMTPGMS